MREYDSEIFGKIPAAGTIDDLLSFIIRQNSSNLVWMWRGQADISWPVHSTAYRRLFNHFGSGTDITEFRLQRYEQSLLERATLRGYRSLDGQTLTDLELLARLRHHGAATRLIDATKSWAVALWFAVSRLPDRPGLLMGIHSDFLLGYEGIPESSTYSEIIEWWTERPNSAWTWEPPNVTVRIAAQHSQFLASALSDSPQGSLAIPAKKEGSLLIAIPAEKKGDIQDALISIFDIRDLTLFPDLNGFGLAEGTGYAPGESFRW